MDKKYKVLLNMIKNFITFFIRYYKYYKAFLSFIYLKLMKKIKKILKTRKKNNILNSILKRGLAKNLDNFIKIIKKILAKKR